jgi:hypothetical protein
VVAELSGKAMNVLQRSVSMRGVRDFSNDDIRRLEMEWNTVFTKLGLVQGQLKARRKRLAETSAIAHYFNLGLTRLLRRPASAF